MADEAIDTDALARQVEERVLSEMDTVMRAHGLQGQAVMRDIRARLNLARPSPWGGDVRDAISWMSGAAWAYAGQIPLDAEESRLVQETWIERAAVLREAGLIEQKAPPARTISMADHERSERTCPACGRVTERRSVDGGASSIYTGECGHRWVCDPAPRLLS